MGGPKAKGDRNHELNIIRATETIYFSGSIEYLIISNSKK